MKVLVTGGAGYIGSVCVEYFLEHGLQVTVLDNLSEGHRSAVPAGARFVEASLSEADRLHPLLGEGGFDAVVHFAAKALVGESMTDPGLYFRNNVSDALNLLDAARAAGVQKFIFSSTCATYGVPDQIPMTEETPQRPINPYGESKLMFERALFWYRQIHGIRPVIFRYFNAAGATENLGEHHRIETHLIPNVLRVALGKADHCTVFGTDYPTPDGTCIRDYIHVRDLAQAHHLALQPDAEGAFNLGTGRGFSVREVIDACRRITGHPIPVREENRRPGDPPSLVAAADRARSVLGWQPRFDSIEAIVDSAWTWHQHHPDGYPD